MESGLILRVGSRIRGITTLKQVERFASQSTGSRFIEHV